SSWPATCLRNSSSSANCWWRGCRRYRANGPPAPAAATPASPAARRRPVGSPHALPRAPGRAAPWRRFLNQMVDNSAGRDILNHMVQDRSPTLVLVFHALAHPARRAMLRRLAEAERNLSELAAPLRMSFPAA